MRTFRVKAATLFQNASSTPVEGTSDPTQQIACVFPDIQELADCDFVDRLVEGYAAHVEKITIFAAPENPPKTVMHQQLTRTTQFGRLTSFA